MMNNPNFPRRLWTNYFTTLANANPQQFTFVTNDDYRDRYIETIFVGLATAGMSIALFVTGQDYSVIDLSRFAAGDAVLHVDIKIPAKLQATVVLQDIAGAAHANVPVIIGYRVDPTTGP
jgi:hypothetical protein